MNWWQRLKSNPYKWGLWKWIGGRPWTFISRDIWHLFEYLPIMLLLFAGFFTGYHWAKASISLWWLVPLWGVSTIWYVLGHFFYGRDWIKGQQGK